MNKPFKRKRIIEIYFVLYLMALILILPGKKDDGGNVDDDSTTNIFEFPYSLKPVNNILNAKILITQDTIEVLSMDSINTIYYTGEVSHIDFEFVVEDLSINSELHIDNKENKSNKFFKIQADTKRQAAVFTWNPPTNDPRDRTYLVTVNAKIKPEKIKGKSQGEDINISTEFSINVDFVTPSDLNNAILATDALNSDPAYSNYSSSQMMTAPKMNTGELSLDPGNQIISTLSGEAWKNYIYIIGMNLESELKNEPKLIIEHSDENNGGSATATRTKDNGILIEGIAPDYGSNKIKLVVNRIDGKTAETEFSVVLSSIGSPQMPKIMYPEITYIIDPKIPPLTTQNAYSILKNNRGEELQRATGNKIIYYTPTYSDTGSTVFLERYMNNRLTDQSKKIRISGNIAPRITRLQKLNKNEVKIATYSLGIYNGRENIVEKLILTGNATYYLLSGQMRTDKQEHSYDQYFMINPKDKSKPFEFTVQAVSVEGKKSEIKKGSE